MKTALAGYLSSEGLGREKWIWSQKQEKSQFIFQSIMFPHVRSKAELTGKVIAGRCATAFKAFH